MKSKDKDEDYKASNTHIAKLMKFTNFSLTKKKDEKDSKKKKKKGNDSPKKGGVYEKLTELTVPMFEVKMPMEKPFMRFVLDRACM